jgi:hypothetical protein
VPPPNALQSIEHELAAESAASLGRAGARLEEALDALRAFDAAGGPRAHREPLLLEAAERLWYYVVQREVLGFHDSELAMAVYRVPGEVRVRMGRR